ncbi:MAG TPA: type I polyketide synthase [Gemmatimonadaceae bacterium]|jgi:acyl transferase domain-containing protein/acyl carrier protein
MSDAFKTRLGQLSPQQLQLLALDLRARLDRIQDERREPIAVVGMGCRFPGAENPEAFWDLISKGEDKIREVPLDRWNIEDFFDANPDARGRMATRWGGFLDRIKEFDPEFFGISPREANGMDPQQRLLLEVTWEALENAGIAPGGLRGSRMGVFVGVCNGDYYQLCTSRGYASFDTYLATGTTHSVASGRLSYVLGLEGPAASIDTACSSSLFAVHLAVRSLRNNESRMAIAGGVNVIVWPGGTIAMSAGRMMAPDGRCKSFDARGDGFVRAEGCGVVVLKRLSDAIADGDRVLALIRGTATNQDGRSNGLTAPNGPSQTAVVTDALADSGVSPAAVSYVEAHGTGTPLGDPIELHALGAALSAGRATTDPVVVGSVKTNIGHSEGAAGIAGLIKTILMLRARQIPPSLHFETPNPMIEWSSIPIKVATSLTSWAPTQGKRIAGVSSFGFSGSNAHIIVEEAPTPVMAPVPAPTRDVHLVALSGRSEHVVRDLAREYEAAIERDSSLTVPDIALTAGAGRTHFEHRIGMVARGRDELRRQLRAAADGTLDASVLRGRSATGEAPRVAFLYTGQGTQYAGMGASLYRTEPVFRAALDRCAAILAPILPSNVLELLLAENQADRRIHNAPFTLPAMLSIQFALTQLWQSWGINPTAVMGHSAGEYGAAVTAGVMSIEDALLLVAERARLMQIGGGEGIMLAVFATEEELRGYLAEHLRVSIGAYNGPDSLVLSGPRADVDRINAALTAAAIETRSLEISYASHSILMEPVLDEFESAVARASLTAPTGTLISNLTGTVAGGEIATSNYWRRHLRQSVRFADGMAQLTALGIRAFVEIGPHPSLISMARRYTGGEETLWLASMRRDRDAAEQMIESLATMYVEGADVAWRGVAAGTTAKKVTLPTYPFERETYWLDFSAGGGVAAGSTVVEAGAGLPGRLTEIARGPVVLDGMLSRATAPWLDAHRVGGMAIAPGPFFIDLAVAAAKSAFKYADAEIANLSVDAPLAIPDGTAVRVQTILERATTGAATVEILSQDETGRWTSHARCEVRPTNAAPSANGKLRPVANTPVDVDAHYARIEAFGISFGPEFRRVRSLAIGDAVAMGTVALVGDPGLGSAIHPAAIDACLHVLGAALPNEADAFLMVGADRVSLKSSCPVGDVLDVIACLRQGDAASADEVVADVWALDASGEVVVALDGIRLRRAKALRRADAASAIDALIYDIQWQQAASVTAAAESLAGEHWLLVGGPSAIRDAIAGHLTALGGRATIIDLDTAGDHAGAVESRIATALSTIEHTPTRVLFVEGAANAANENEPFAEHVERLCRSALAAAHDIIRREWKARLWFVASGATPATGSHNVAAGALFGFGRSLANEHPEFWGGLIDVDGSTHEAIAPLVREVIGANAEPEVAFGDRGRHVPRLGRVAQRDASRTALSLRGDVTYVVTGAFGGIGMKVLAWLVERGARHIAILARRAPGDAQRTLLDRLTATGATLNVVHADMAHRAEIAQALTIVREQMPPIAGVFHVAGIYNDAIIERMDWPRFESVLLPKTYAAWHLHELTRTDALEHFVMFSSGASFLGPVGLSNYAAANAGLDAIAFLRRGEGRPALSVDWGPWANTGMAEAVGGGRQSQWSQTGFSVMSPDEALGVLDRLMVRGEPARAAALPVDWRVFRASAPGRHALYSAFDAPTRDAVSTAGTGGDAGDSRSLGSAVLAATDPAERLARLTEYVRVEVGRELGIRPDRLPLDKRLNALGLDSLMAVQLRNRIQDALRITIPVSRFVEGPSVQQLSEGIAVQLAEGAPTPTVSAAEPTADASVVDVESLSDADVERMLLELLEESEKSL